MAMPAPGSQPLRSGHRARALFLGAAFFLSGAAALVYQVVWQRILALQSGVGIYSVAMIVAAFLAGLGVGSYLGGEASRKLSPAASLWAFALLELAVAVFGLLSCGFYYDWLHVRWSSLYARPLSAAALHFTTLFLPTCCMGMSLPLLVRATVSSARAASRTIGLLYGLNVLGASFGAVATPWLLVRFLGMRGAVQVAALLNLAACLTSLAVGRAAAFETDPEGVGLPPGETPASRSFAYWAGLYAVSGFCALSLEIVWFRVVEVATKATSFSFGTVLGVYLLGSALGSLAGVVLVERVGRPLRAFLLCQCLILAYAAVSLLGLVDLPDQTPFYRGYVWYWGSAEVFSLGEYAHSGLVFRLFLVLPLLLFGPPTFLMGMSFPILQRAVQDDVSTSGRKVGFLQAANVAGCVVGSLLVGLLGLEWLGTTGTLRLLLGIGLLLAALGQREYRRGFVALGLLLAVLALALPNQRQLWLRLHGSPEGLALQAEDATGVAAIVPTGPHRFRVFVGGKSHSWLPFGGIHTKLGAMPAIIHPHPDSIAIVGLGSGDTAWAAACRAETRSLTVFEVLAPQPRLLREIASEVPKLRLLGELLADPRMGVRLADGRNALEHEDRSYDLIQGDPLHPAEAYAGHLYSLEYFELCRRRLRKGGMMCSWAPTPRSYATFMRAFPHVLALDGGAVLLGSNEPIEMDRGGWRERFQQAAGYLGSASDLVWQGLESAAPATAAGERSLDLDLFPRDEFLTP